MTERIKVHSHGKDGVNLVVEVLVVSQEQYDGGPFEFGQSRTDGSLDRVIASLQSIRDTIPEQYRNVARCEITSVSSYGDSHYASIEISYQRPATQDEADQWRARERNAAAAREAQERAAFELLKAKYGNQQA